MLTVCVRAHSVCVCVCMSPFGHAVNSVCFPPPHTHTVIQIIQISLDEGP
jgi:hypothetical protein